MFGKGKEYTFDPIMNLIVHQVAREAIAVYKAFSDAARKEKIPFEGYRLMCNASIACFRLFYTSVAPHIGKNGDAALEDFNRTLTILQLYDVIADTASGMIGMRHDKDLARNLQASYNVMLQLAGDKGAESLVNLMLNDVIKEKGQPSVQDVGMAAYKALVSAEKTFGDTWEGVKIKGTENHIVVTLKG